MRKKILFILLLIISIFFIKDDVFAYLDGTNTEIECVYANGVVIGLNYDSISGKQAAYVKEYPISKSVVIDGDPITNISLYNSSHAVERLKTLTCPSYVHYWIAWELASTQDKDGNTTDKGNRTFKGVYSFDWCTNKAKGCANGDPSITSALKSTRSEGWWIFSTEVATGGTINVTSKDLASGSQALPDAKIPLVGERLFIVGDIGDNAYALTYRVYNGDADGDGKEDEQAVGNKKYAQVYLGDWYKNGIADSYFLHVGDTITYLGSSIFTGTYVCIKDSVLEEDASRGDSGKKFSSIRHAFQSSSQTANCPTGYTKYVKTTETCKISSGNSAGSFCDKYNKTSLVIIDIVKIMQILVPALTIVLTGIEIGRIVVAGNVDEELPKRKKSMIIRFIIMIAFLFLPLITQLIINLAEGVAILDVSCLFNDGQETNTSLNEQNCDNLIKDQDEN